MRRTAVVTPYGLQVEATLDAFRDQESAGTPVTEVGTAHRFQGREFPIVVFDLVEDEHRKRWMARASRQGNMWERDGVRLFNVAITRAQTRLYLISNRRCIDTAPAGTPLAHLAALLDQRRATAVRATQLVTAASLTGPDRPLLGPVSTELSEILAQHVRVTAIQDERDFYQTFADHLGKTRHPICIWAPWTTSRVRSILPLLTDAAGRGVRTVLFVRDPCKASQPTRSTWPICAPCCTRSSRST